MLQNDPSLEAVTSDEYNHCTTGYQFNGRADRKKRKKGEKRSGRDGAVFDRSIFQLHPLRAPIEVWPFY